MLDWYFRRRHRQHRFNRCASLFNRQFITGRSCWGCVFRRNKADALGVRGQPHGGSFAWYSAVGSHQCNRGADHGGPEARVERGRNATAFPRFSGMGGVRCDAGDCHPGIARSCRAVLRSRTRVSGVAGFGEKSHRYFRWRIRGNAHGGVS